MRPTTAVTNSAVDSASTREMSQVAGTTVRYGSRANPTTIQAMTHVTSEGPGVPGILEQPTIGPGEHQPDETPEGGAQETDVADQRRPQVDGPTRRTGGRRSA